MKEKPCYYIRSIGQDGLKYYWGIDNKFHATTCMGNERVYKNKVIAIKKAHILAHK